MIAGLRNKKQKNMDCKKTFGNHILLKLDAENDHIKLKGGMTLYVDNTYEPEKHQTVTGEVCGLPSHLTYTGAPNQGMPWKTDMELQEGEIRLFAIIWRF